MIYPPTSEVLNGITVIDDCIIDWAGSPRPSPLWVRASAAEYAKKHGLTTIAVTAYFETAEYKRQAAGNLRVAQRIADSDVAANGGQPDTPINDRTPYQKGDDHE